MRFRIVPPSPIRDMEETVGFCGEKMCKKKPTVYTLLLAWDDNGTIEFLVPLCDEHAKEMRVRECPTCGGIEHVE